jgi:hypothetical protein
MIVMYHKFGYELDGVKKQIRKWCALAKTKRILQWPRQLDCQLQWPLTIKWKDNHSGAITYRKEVYLPILKN